MFLNRHVIDRNGKRLCQCLSSRGLTMNLASFRQRNEEDTQDVWTVLFAIIGLAVAAVWLF